MNVREKILDSPSFFMAGSDGTYSFWDKENRQKLGPNYKDDKGNSSALKFNLPLTAGDISPDGKLFVYAVGYDWSFGCEFSNQEANKPKIYIHPGFVNEPYMETQQFTGSMDRKTKVV